MFRAPCAHHQEVKTVLYSIWYHHTCRWPSGAQVERRLSQTVHGQITDAIIVPHIHWMDPTACPPETAKIKFYAIDGFRTLII